MDQTAEALLHAPTAKWHSQLGCDGRSLANNSPAAQPDGPRAPSEAALGAGEVIHFTVSAHVAGFHPVPARHRAPG
jgi:hypothetical protein